MDTTTKKIAKWCGVAVPAVEGWINGGMPVDDVALLVAWLSVHSPHHVAGLLGLAGKVSTPPCEGVGLDGLELRSTVERYRQLEYWAWADMVRIQREHESNAEAANLLAVMQAAEKYRNTVGQRIRIEKQVGLIVACRRWLLFRWIMERALVKTLAAFFLRKRHAIRLLSGTSSRKDRQWV